MWRTIGHDWAVQTLARALEAGRVARTLLLAGPAHIGKTHLALELGMALNCAGADPPCQVCSGCARALQGAHPDIRLVQPEGGRLKIDQIRALQYELSLSPVLGQRRVCVLTDFQTATVEAANAFLKTLEEPPSRAVIILTALDVGLLLPTVISRCQVFPLRLAPVGRIAQALVERWKVSHETAETLARLSAGRVGWAIHAAQHPQVLAERQRQLEELAALLTVGRAQRLRAAERYARDERLPELIQLWQTWWRDVVLLCAGCQELIANVDHRAALQRTAEGRPLAEVHGALRATDTALGQLEQNVNSRLALEVMFLRWPRLSA
jgi:DNA polymerase-3 subunit delta'